MVCLGCEEDRPHIEHSFTDNKSSKPPSSLRKTAEDAEKGSWVNPR